MRSDKWLCPSCSEVYIEMQSNLNLSNYIDILLSIASTSTCLRRHTAAIVVSPGGRVIGMGSNGAPSNVESCLSLNKCFRKHEPRGTSLDSCTAMHAELAAIIDGLRSRRDLTSCSIYCTDSPCMSCLKSIVHVGITKVYYIRDYPVQHLESYNHVAGAVQMHKINLNQHLKQRDLELNLS